MVSHLKKFLKVVILFFFIIFNVKVNAFTFQIFHNGIPGNSYSDIEYKDFIEELQNNFLHPAGNIVVNISDTDTGRIIQLAIDTNNLYITEINGVPVRNPNYVYSAEQVISYSAISQAIYEGERDEAYTIRVMAFITSEAARFANIAEATNRVLNNYDQVRWEAYISFMKNWANISKNIQKLVDAHIIEGNIRNRNGFYVGIYRIISMMYLSNVIYNIHFNGSR